MDEVIKLLRQQVVLCSRLVELLTDLLMTLKDNENTQLIVQKIEPIIVDLNKNSGSSKAFLDKNGAMSFGELISQAQGDSAEVAVSLIKKSVILHKKLSWLMRANDLLLANASAFVNFNLNVLSQAQIQTAYGSELKTKTQTRRLFDTNV